ncbi:MAG: hypothetical protein JW779_01895 [Candidatus Thorarchaeota archaeon]|nr:hypothetical protein [Candidatus Thorarchaeota archaeon]
MTDELSLDNLPDEVFVALGRRGMEGIPLKECTYQCDGKELELLHFRKDKETLKGSGVEEVIEDWIVKCKTCSRTFTIRCYIRYADGERADTRVDILDDKGTNLGWLGSY